MFIKGPVNVMFLMCSEARKSCDAKLQGVNAKVSWYACGYVHMNIHFLSKVTSSCDFTPLSLS